MIVSHRHKFIFFAVPKTATHAIRAALRPHLDPDDWEQQVLFGEQSLPIPEIARLKHGHITAQEIRPHLEDRQWDDYFKFGFVRNPFDRYVSTCFFLNRDNPNFSKEAARFMKQRIQRKPFQQRVLVRAQYQQLIGEDGELALDYVGHYETLQESYNSICARIGFEPGDLAQKNQSTHRSFREYYDAELQDLVANFYAEDLRRFDYGFDPS